MEVLKRQLTDQLIDDPKRPKVVEEQDSDSSEDEAELLERLFGANQPSAPVVEEVDEKDEIEDEKPIIGIDEKKDDEDECVWQDEDDDEVVLSLLDFSSLTLC